MFPAQSEMCCGSGMEIEVAPSSPPHAVAGFFNSLSTNLGGTVNTFPKRFETSTAVFPFAGKGTQELLS